MIFSCLSLFASARQNTTNDPVIYLRGDGGKIYAADGVTEVRKDLDKSKLVDMVKSVIFRTLSTVSRAARMTIGMRTMTNLPRCSIPYTRTGR